MLPKGRKNNRDDLWFNRPKNCGNGQSAAK